jgi:hypothetical protein
MNTERILTRRPLHRFEALACAVGAVVLCVLQPWFLIPAALFGLVVMALSENRVASFVGRWAWKALGYGLALGAFWLWLQILCLVPNRFRYGIKTS